MAKQLTLDELLDCLTVINHPSARACQAVVEAIGTIMADTIAAALGVTAGAATFQGAFLAGTCAPFRPAFPGQPCPSPLSDYDSEEWDDDPHPSLAPAAGPSAIRRYTVETTIRRPFYKHRVYEAATPEDTCRQALQDDDCEGESWTTKRPASPTSPASGSARTPPIKAPACRSQSMVTHQTSTRCSSSICSSPF